MVMTPTTKGSMIVTEMGTIGFTVRETGPITVVTITRVGIAIQPPKSPAFRTDLKSAARLKLAVICITVTGT